MAQPLFQTSYCLQVAGEFDQRVQLFKMRRQCLTCIPKQLSARLVGRRVCRVEGASGVEHVAFARRIVSPSAGGENLAVGAVLSVPLIEPTSAHLVNTQVPVRYHTLCYISSSISLLYFTPFSSFIVQ